MTTLDKQIKKMEAYPSLTPDISHLLKRQFLEIMTKEDEKDLLDWTNKSESNNNLLQLWLKFSNRKRPNAFSVDHRLKEVAAYANITLRVFELLHYVFLDHATELDIEELDDWVCENIANDRLLDLLVEFNFQNSVTETLNRLRKLYFESNPQHIFSFISLSRLINSKRRKRKVHPSAKRPINF